MAKNDGSFLHHAPRGASSHPHHISAERRAALPKSEFGLPSKKKYPVDTRKRAANAKSRAAQQVGKSITEDEEHEIDEKADRKLAKKR